MQSLLKILTQDPSSFSTQHIRQATHLICTGQATPCQVGAFLIALKCLKLESDPHFISAMALELRQLSVPLVLNDHLMIDIVGTGGDGKDTFNVSTASAIVAAGAGCKVAKVSFFH